MKTKTIREIANSKIKFPQKSGDFQILCHANKRKDFILVTHDEKLSCILLGKIISMFLIEYIIENNIRIPYEKEHYLYEKTLKKYDKNLKELRKEVGFIAPNFHLRNIKIKDYLNSRSGDILTKSS